MRNPCDTDGILHLNLYNQHWTRSMLPGLAKQVRLFSDFSLLNHQRKHLLRALGASSPPPLGFLGLMYQDDTPLRALLNQRGIPAVNLSSTLPPEDIPGVYADNRAVGRMAAEHLLKLMPRTFAFLDVGDNALSDLRHEGFRDCIRESLPDAEVPRLRGNKEVYRTALADLSTPAALFCATDNRARAAAVAAQSLGLNIPQDLAILGVDNDLFECEMTRVPLSSVAIPFEEIGSRAMDLMLSLLRGEAPPPEPVLIGPTHVETRLSSDPFIFEDELVTRAARLIRQPRPDPLNVAQLAEALDVSRRTLELRFRKAEAGSVHDMIHEMRLQRAAALLNESRLTVAEISREIGIQDFRRFSQLFKQRYGQTPGRYRRNDE